MIRSQKPKVPARDPDYENEVAILGIEYNFKWWKNPKGATFFLQEPDGRRMARRDRNLVTFYECRLAETEWGNRPVPVDSPPVSDALGA